MLSRFLAARRWHALLIVLVCLAVYWPLLGVRSFGSSEGHRVIPGWTMLDTGDWWHIKMFGLTYVRKPPGMPWTIAAFSKVLGETEFAARAVSATAATLAALVAFAFATRWFGSPYGLAAGLAQALMPLFWPPGRTAEIEMLNNLATQAGCFCVIELLDGRRRSWLASIPLAVLGATGVIAAALVKGPASVPVFAAVLIGAGIAQRSAFALLRPGIGLVVLISAMVLTGFGKLILQAGNEPDAVREDVTGYLWSHGRLLGVATLAPLAFLSALPTSLALLFPWGKDARHGQQEEGGYKFPAQTGVEDVAGATRAFIVARSLAIGWIIALVLLVAVGVSNPRYAMPAAMLLPPLAACFARGCGSRVGAFAGQRRRLAVLLTFRNPASWPVVLLVASGLSLYYTGVRQPDADDSRVVGTTLAGSLPTGATIWADDLIEARPDVLLYAQRAARAQGHEINPVWAKPPMLRGELPPPGTFIVLRTDAASAEPSRYSTAVSSGSIVKVANGRVAKFSFVVYRVTR